MIEALNGLRTDIVADQTMVVVRFDKSNRKLRKALLSKRWEKKFIKAIAKLGFAFPLLRVRRHQ